MKFSCAKLEKGAYQMIDCKPQGDKVIFFRETSVLNIFDCNIKSNYTNMGFRLAYFLWNLRGSNALSHLISYNDHVQMFSDDGVTLRGAYGPRMRHWIGADQLQEATKKNLDIDEPKDMVKPEPVDQLQSICQDLDNGINVSNCIIFDPAVDFEDSNNIPDLINMSFIKSGNNLHMNVNYASAIINGYFINDYYFLSMLHICMGILSGLRPGVMYINIESASYIIQEELVKTDRIIDYDLFEKKTSDEFWQDIFNICDFDKHLRITLNKDSMNNPDIALETCVDRIKEKLINPINSLFWKDYGLCLGLCYLQQFKDCVPEVIKTWESELKTPLGEEYKEQLVL